MGPVEGRLGAHRCGSCICELRRRNETGIKDVAARAGVSISTVSYVMSGKRSISKETRDKVMQAAADLGYRTKAQKARDAAGKQAGDAKTRFAADDIAAGTSGVGKRKRSHTKVLAVSSPVHSYTDYSNYAQFFFGLATSARQHGYDLMLLMHESGGAEMRRVADNNMADGILMLDVLMDDSRAEVAKSIDLPVVSVGYPENCGSVYSVDLDFARMAREIAEHAYELGHRHLLFVGTNAAAYRAGSNFLVRFHDALMERTKALGMSVVFKCSSIGDLDEANRMLEDSFAEDPGISLIVAQTSAVQIGNMQTALYRMGKRVPPDVSMLAAGTCGGMMQLPRPVDEIPMAPTRVCQRAIDLMLEVIDGERNDLGHIELLPYEYQARGTVVSARIES